MATKEFKNLTLNPNQDVNTPKYNRTTGLLTDFGRFSGLPQVNPMSNANLLDIGTLSGTNQPLMLPPTTVSPGAGDLAYYDNIAKGAETSASDNAAQLKSGESEITRLMQEIGGAGATQDHSQEDAARKQVSFYTNKIRGEQLATREQIKALRENYGGSEAGFNQEANRLQMDSSFRQANDSLSLAIASDNYSMFADISQRQLDTKLSVLNSELEARKFIFENNRQLFDKQEERAFQQQITKEEREYEKTKTIETNKTEGKSFAVKYAMESGQSDIAAQIQALDNESETFTEDLARLQSQIRNPNMALDLAIKKQQLANLQKTNSLMGEPTEADKKKEAAALQTANGQVDTLKEKVSLIDGILASGGISSRVGTNFLSRLPEGEGITGTIKKGIQNLLKIPLTLGIGTSVDVRTAITGQGQQFSGSVHKLTSQEFLDALIGAKQQGATFGALTDREGDALRASATQLNDWEIKNDKGLGIGVWNIDEESFKKELNNLKMLANKGIQNAQGTVFEQEEQSLLDNMFSPDNMALDPSLYY